jgi:hypothetical protein
MLPLERPFRQRLENALDQHGAVAEIDDPFQSQQAVPDAMEGGQEFASVCVPPGIEQVARSSGGATLDGAWQGTCCSLGRNPRRPRLG